MKNRFGRYVDKKVTILGYGRTGKALAELMTNIGARVFISEVSDLEELANSGYEYETGGHSERVFDCDIMLPSPGLSLSSRVLMRAKELGIEIRGEIDFSAELLPCPYISVTGTSGKSTTTSLIATMLNDYGVTSYPVGNIGDSVANYVLTAQQDWVLSIEVGSPMCELMDTFHPKVGVFLNLSEDHLDRHGTMEIYAQMKQKILRFMTHEDTVVLNYDDSWSRSLAKKTNAKKLFFSSFPNQNVKAYIDNDGLVVGSKVFARMDEFKLKGRYNATNILAATLACSHFGVPVEKAIESVKTFKSLKHRLELIGEWGGIKFINDSKSTKPDSTILTMKTLESPFILILGGSEKGSDFTKLAESMAGVKLAIVHGVTADKIIKSLEKAGYKKYGRVGNQEEAIRLAIRNASKGDTVLLSPACASFDQYRDFEERGELFEKEVRSLAPKTLGS